MKHTEKQPRIFYGWYILAIGMIGAFLSAGTSQLFMSIMLKPLTAEFGWSRTAATGAITTGTIMAGILAFPFGALADRYGPRLLTSLGALVTGATYFLLTKSAELWQFYVVFVIARVVSTNTISTIAPRTAAVNWFRRFRGRALGLLSMSTPLGSSILVIVAQSIMERHGWRTVFMMFALALLFLQVLPAALVLRRRPEDCGLLPDGGPAVEKASASPLRKPLEKEFNWTLREAVRTPTMWFLVSATIMALIVNAGVGFHLVAYYTDVGIAVSAAVAALSVYAFTGAMASVIWGFLSEKISERLLAALVMVLTAFTILYLESVRTAPGAFIFAVLFGLTSRGEGTLVSIILAQYYGRGSFGAISGFVLPFNMLGLGFGPLIASVSFDRTGSYDAVFTVFIGISLIAAILLWLAKKPAQPVRSSACT
jgi:sugar phosphate permease